MILSKMMSRVCVCSQQDSLVLSWELSHSLNVCL